MAYLLLKRTSDMEDVDVLKALADVSNYLVPALELVSTAFEHPEMDTELVEDACEGLTKAMMVIADLQKTL